MNNQWFSKVAVWLVIALVLFTVFKQFDTRGGSGAGYLAYSDFLEEVRGKRIKSATIQEGQGGTEIVAVMQDDRKVRTNATYLDRGLVGDLIANGVKFDVKPREEGSLLMTLLVSWGPMLLLIGVWVYFMRQMQGGGKGGAFSFGKSKARMLDENNNTVTFADVAGCDEAKEEVKEVVDFLKDPQKFQKLGGRIPRGLLLVGPPGTGKTLLAKGIAGEAKVPFFSISGSDFVEMFVGVGAARVRDMFENAKKNAPCIIFIDEIDAVGRQRGAGLGGGGGGDDPLRAVRRGGPARAGPLGNRRGQPWRLRPDRRRDRGAGHAGCHRPPDPRCPWQPRLDRGGKLFGRPAGTSAIHAACGLGRAGNPAGPNVRPSRRDREVAAGRARATDAGAAAGFVGQAEGLGPRGAGFALRQGSGVRWSFRRGLHHTGARWWHEAPGRARGRWCGGGWCTSALDRKAHSPLYAPGPGRFRHPGAIPFAFCFLRQVTGQRGATVKAGLHLWRAPLRGRTRTKTESSGAASPSRANREHRKDRA